MNNLADGANKYCGPAALSIITGHSIDRCASILGEVSNKIPKKIKGVFIKDFIEGARRLRVIMTEVDHLGGSLYSQITALYSKPGLYLVSTKKHFFIIEITAEGQVLFNDNHTKIAMKASGSARLSEPVESIYHCVPKPNPIILGDQIMTEFDKDFFCRVRRRTVYQDSDDDLTVLIGTLMFKNKDEIVYLRNRLDEFLKGGG